MLPFNTRLFLGHHHLEAHGLYNVEDRETVLDFIQKCPADVIFMLRLYEVELGKTLVDEIIDQLFLMFKENYNSTDNSFARDFR